MRILDAAREWFAVSELRPSTLQSYAYSFGACASGGIRDTDEISRTSFLRFARERRERGISSSTCNRNLAALCSLCRWLWETDRFPLERYLELQRCFFEQTPAPPPYYLLPEEFLLVRSVAERLHPTLGRAVDLAVHTGLRLGELRRLHHEDLHLSDADGAYLSVGRTHGRETKTFRTRTVPIRAAFVERLNAIGVGRGDGPVFPSRRRIGETNREPYVNEGTLEAWLREARTIARLPRMTWTTCRHTFATWAVQARPPVELDIVAGWLGNTEAVCRRHYAAHRPGGDLSVERGFARLAELERSSRRRA